MAEKPASEPVEHRGLSNVHFWNGRCTCTCRACIGVGGACICTGCDEHALAGNAPEEGPR